MHEIIIFGTTGVGKTLYADALKYAAISGGISVAISDHELFYHHSSYKEKLEKVKKRHGDSNVDISIIVVNDGGKNLRVDFGGRVPYRLACVLFPNGHSVT